MNQTSEVRMRANIGKSSGGRTKLPHFAAILSAIIANSCCFEPLLVFEPTLLKVYRFCIRIFKLNSLRYLIPSREHIVNMYISLNADDCGPRNGQEFSQCSSSSGLCINLDITEMFSSTTGHSLDKKCCIVSSGGGSSPLL